MYFIRVYQQSKVIRIEISLKINEEYIGAYVSLVSGGKVTTPLVCQSVDFELVSTSDEALAIADWWRIAAQAADVLSYHIKTPADFDKEWQARIVGRSIVFSEAHK